jgi:hypothetical protein
LLALAAIGAVGAAIILLTRASDSRRQSGTFAAKTTAAPSTSAANAIATPRARAHPRAHQRHAHSVARRATAPAEPSTHHAKASPPATTIVETTNAAPALARALSLKQKIYETRR